MTIVPGKATAMQRNLRAAVKAVKELVGMERLCGPVAHTHERPVGVFQLTFAAPIAGPVGLGYASHYGLGLFLPVQMFDGHDIG